MSYVQERLAEIKAQQAPRVVMPLAGAALKKVSRAKKAEDPIKGRAGFIYFIAESNLRFVKIGFSANLGARMLDLQGGNPRAMQLVAKFPAYKCSETDVHKRFSHLRIRREWFKFGPEIDDFFDDIVDYQVWKNGALRKSDYKLMEPEEVQSLLDGDAPWVGELDDAA